MDPFAPVKKSDVAPPSDLSKEIANKATNNKGFIPNFRIVQPVNSSPENQAGDWMLGNDNIGKEFEAVIALWRFHAVRFKNEQADAEDFNMSVDSAYNHEENEWLHQRITPGYQAILDKVVPDVPGVVSNCAGYDILFWLPEFNSFGIYLLARTALTMPRPSVLDVVKDYRGRTCKMTTYQAPTKKSYKWWLPQITLLDKTIEIPKTQEVADAVKLFMDPPGGRFDPNATSSVR